MSAADLEGVSAPGSVTAPTATPETPAPGDPVAPVLSATGVTVRFGGLVALSDVSLEVPASTIVGWSGPASEARQEVLDRYLGEADQPVASA